MLLSISSILQTPTSCWLKRPNTQEGLLLCTLGGEKVLQKSGGGGSSSDSFVYGMLCSPCAASWWPGGRSWCAWGRPCWSRTWFCCSWCSWGVSWGICCAGWCSCTWASGSTCSWLSCISGISFLSTVTKRQFCFLSNQPIRWNDYQKTNKMVQSTLTMNLWRGFYLLWFQPLHMLNCL